MRRSIKRKSSSAKNQTPLLLLAHDSSKSTADVSQTQKFTSSLLDKFVSLSDQKLANVSHGPDDFSVFVFGRGSYEDLALKGYDIIANAVGSLGEKFKIPICWFT